MDVQLKKGLLDLCVLKVLQKEDSYGYQIINDIASHIEISESTLYPILKRLEQNSFLTTYSKEYNGRLRKYYSITKEGVERLKTAMHDYLKIQEIYNFILEEDDNDKGRIS